MINTNKIDKINNYFPSTLKLFARHFAEKYNVYLMGMILIDLIIIAYVTIQPYIFKKIIDAATLFLGKPNFIKVMLTPCVILFTINIIYPLIWRLNNYICLRSMPKLKADIIEETSSYINKQSFKFFQDNLGGSISNKIMDLANNTELLIFNGRSLFRNLLLLVSTFLIAFIVHPVFSLIFLVATIVLMIASFWISFKIEPFSKEFAETRSNVVGNIVDLFTNVINTILFARANYEKQYLQATLEKMIVKDQIMQRKLMYYSFLLSSLSFVMLTLTVAFLIYFGTKGTVTPGDFALIFICTFSILDHVWVFSETLFKVSEEVGVLNQALLFISKPLEVIDPKDAKPLKVEVGTIVFSKVNFSYTAAQEFFKNITLIVNGREKIGLVGSSGSGKSSLVNLITRIFDIQNGDILIDNQSIYKTTLQSLRENIAFIPQEPLLFHRSIIENIRYGNIEASYENIILAAKKSHAHEFIIELPKGYQTLVGERGMKLSAGQKQRIAIARAILKNAPILILDEATSALDSITEQLIQQSLKIAMKNKTVIVIAHRLSTIKAMDRILVFDKGQIIEEGTHEYLLAKGQIYKNLWEKQQVFLT